MLFSPHRIGIATTAAASTAGGAIGVCFDFLGG